MGCVSIQKQPNASKMRLSYWYKGIVDAEQNYN